MTQKVRYVTYDTKGRLSASARSGGAHGDHFRLRPGERDTAGGGRTRAPGQDRGLKERERESEREREREREGGREREREREGGREREREGRERERERE